MNLGNAVAAQKAADHDSATQVRCALLKPTRKIKLTGKVERVRSNPLVGMETHYEGRVCAYDDNPSLPSIYVARVRAGFVPALRVKVFERFNKLEIKTCPFSNLPQRDKGRWGQGLTANKMAE
jgi:hypothetical protein